MNHIMVEMCVSDPIICKREIYIGFHLFLFSFFVYLKNKIGQRYTEIQASNLLVKHDMHKHIDGITLTIFSKQIT